MSIPTPHIEAKAGEIAKTVLMPGDPLRAKFIAETFLEDAKQFNGVRGMLGYTGTYKGREISVMGHGMGIPSVGIYSYELYAFYGVENIIRIGSCGANTMDLDLYDVVLATSCYSPSTYGQVLAGYEEDVFEADAELTGKLEVIANRLEIPVTKGCVSSGDVFYAQPSEARKKIYEEKEIIAMEMEFFGLCANAKLLNKKAACLLTVSDHALTREETTSEERQTAFTKMMEIALEMAE